MKHDKDSLEVVSGNGEFICYLNPGLVDKQNLTDSEIAALKTTHRLRYELFAIAANMKSPEALKALAKFFSKLESEQQRLWHFDVDENYYRFFDFPGCTCPKMDNAERLGTPYHIISMDCPIHGEGINVDKS